MANPLSLLSYKVNNMVSRLSKGENMDIRSTIRRYARVLQIARKPGKDEFISSSKICALGIAVIGFVGFVIFLAFILTGI